MPTVLSIGRYRFFFYSREGTEEPHIHVEAAENSAKYWLTPVSRASSKRFRTAELFEIEQLVFQNREKFVAAWYAHFGQ
jgi:hypothetical protein